ncbi:MAG: Hsp20/alpha crystallin family protein [Thermoleophilia bacterium]|nr:Hsp20/alpha crystallin family protein [Thermoleophilia bacterium]
MTIVRWEPFRELAALQSELSRFTNELWGAPAAGAGGASTWLPALDVWETDAEIVLALDLPGIAEDRVTIEVEDGVLTITGEREREVKQETDRFYRFERRFGRFSRSVTLPQGTDAGQIRAEFKDGVLEVHVPRPAERTPTRIPIGAKGTIEGESTCAR